MSSVSQIITFRKGRAFTTHRPEPPVVPAPPAQPSATVTLGSDAAKRKLAAATYTQQVQRAIKIEFGSRPNDLQQQAVDAAAEAATKPAASPVSSPRADAKDPATKPAEAEAADEHKTKAKAEDEARASDAQAAARHPHVTETHPTDTAAA